MYNDIKSVATAGRFTTTATKLRYSRAGHRKIYWGLAVGDAFGIAFGWLLSLGLLWLVEDEIWRQGIIGWWANLGDNRTFLSVGLTVLALVFFGARGHYSRRRPFFDEILDILLVFLAVAVLDAFLVYLAKWQFSRSWFLTAWLLGLAIVPLTRIFLKRVLIRTRQWQQATVIVGVGPNAREAAEALSGEPLMGLEVTAFLSLPNESTAMTSINIGGRPIPVLAMTQDPYLTLDELGAPQIIVALEAESLLPNQKLVQKLSARYSDLSIIPPLRGLPLYGMEMTHFFSHEVLMLSMRNNLARTGPRFLKRMFDLAASAVLLIVLAPAMVFFSWRIRRTGGKAIFGHPRIGQYGKEFLCLKFRTMVPNAEQALTELLANNPSSRADWERDFKLKKDPRITPIGAFLRATSLDELPQLWNVLKGDMSLVGPRPIVEEELARYGDNAGYYLEAPPGITGLWQISGRNDTGYEDRVALDCWYVRNWSLWYDVVILVKTIGVVFARRGAY
jgi:undecaprenyl-phosphate galactose phosphotransferase